MCVTWRIMKERNLIIIRPASLLDVEDNCSQLQLQQAAIVYKLDNKSGISGHMTSDWRDSVDIRCVALVQPVSAAWRTKAWPKWRSVKPVRTGFSDSKWELLSRLVAGSIAAGWTASVNSSMSSLTASLVAQQQQQQLLNLVELQRRSWWIRQYVARQPISQEWGTSFRH